MAPTLTSNSFLLTTSPHPRLTLKNPTLRVFAKRGGPLSSFQFGKPKDDSSEESESGDPGNSSPFNFNFGKVPDVKSLIPVVSNSGGGLSFGNSRRKDPGTVFVAGATGLVGVRIAQTLLREGFSVRAGVPDLGAAQDLARLAAKYKIISNEESKRLNAVESTFQDSESIARAIGNASKVVVTIGPAENGATTEVSVSDALQVIKAAQLAGVGHVAIIYDETKGTSTYNVLDGISSFFNNLLARNQPLTIPEFLQKVIETDVSYTFIKTSLTEDFSPESSYNVVVSAEGSTAANDYKVAKAQIASVVANVFSNTAVAENKVVKIFTNPSAPARPVDELFSAIPEDGRRAVYAEALAKARAEEEARVAAEKAREAAEAAKKLEEEVKKLSDQEARALSLAEDAQEKAEAAGASVESLLSKAKDIRLGFSWDKFSSQITNAVQKSSEIPKVQIATVRGQTKARTLPPKKAVVKQITPKPSVSKLKQEPKPKGKQTESEPEVRKLFGGLFQQETIYIDDD
ncbi:protein PLASTID TRANSCRIPTIONALLY ACTIVE 16, chloroplastic [Mangifera indica]|uniref:protein PLASTID TRANSCRIPTIONALLY ACTIVE 16, chloroplastic n=1 Tax=Mangifera indica TaxID=29780 RepID=UPI001CFA1558|nr:protein PLASTID TRANSCRIPTIONALLY ACTIVE 16, chloroplastic [Mangifera indica]